MILVTILFFALGWAVEVHENAAWEITHSQDDDDYWPDYEPDPVSASHDYFKHLKT